MCKTVSQRSAKFFNNLHPVQGHIVDGINDGEFVPGSVLQAQDECFFFGVRKMGKQIYVRQVYVVLANRILNRFESAGVMDCGVMLGGTPGIGKLVFLVILLCCCVLRRQWCDHKYDEMYVRLQGSCAVCVYWTGEKYACRDGVCGEQAGKLYLHDMDDR